MDLTKNMTEGTTSVYAGMNEIFNEAKKIIDTMNDGEKIFIDDLTDKVANAINNETTNMSNANVMHLVRLFCNSPASKVKIEVGAGGGVYKGGRPKRVDKRPRCHTCNQVLRTKTELDSSPNIIESTTLH